MKNESLILFNHNFAQFTDLSGTVKIKGHSNNIHFSNCQITLKLFGDYNRIHIENSNTRIMVKGNRNIIVLNRTQSEKGETQIEGKQNQVWVDNEQISASLSSSQVTETYKIIYDEADTAEESCQNLRSNSNVSEDYLNKINKTQTETVRNVESHFKMQNNKQFTGKDNGLITEETTLAFQPDNFFDGVWDKHYQLPADHCLFNDSQDFRVSKKWSIDSFIL